MTDKENKPRILYADDEPSIRQIYKTLFGMVLEVESENVEGFPSGDSLAKRLEEGVDGPGLVLMDNNMAPGPTGMDVLKEYLPRTGYEHLAFVLCSANYELKRNALSAGAYAFIDKPFIPSKVLGIARDAIASSVEKFRKDLTNGNRGDMK